MVTQIPFLRSNSGRLFVPTELNGLQDGGMFQQKTCCKLNSKAIGNQ